MPNLSPGALRAVTLLSPLGVMGNPLPSSSQFLCRECTCPWRKPTIWDAFLPATPRGSCARPAHATSWKAAPRGLPPGSRQCHLLGGGSSCRCQPTQDSEGPGTSLLPHPQPSLESETSSQMLLASAFCETPGSCERLCMKASGVRRGHHRLPGRGSSKQQQQILLSFETASGKDSIKDLESEPSGNCEDHLGYDEDLGPLDVYEIKDALKRADTDDTCLTETLTSHSHRHTQNRAGPT